jgi:hypothetical protein
MITMPENKKMIWDLTAEEKLEIAKEAAREAIAETHALGLPSTHMDNEGIYKLYPDGHKEYTKIFEEKKPCKNPA